MADEEVADEQQQKQGQDVNGEQSGKRGNDRP